MEKQLTIWSGHKFVRPSGTGETVLAGRGLDIENILQGSPGFNIPPLLRTKTQFDEDELEETRCIASIHVHVEQAME